MKEYINTRLTFQKMICGETFKVDVPLIDYLIPLHEAPTVIPASEGE